MQVMKEIDNCDSKRVRFKAMLEIYLGGIGEGDIRKNITTYLIQGG